MTGYLVVSVEQMIEQLGDEKCRNIFSRFSCPLNLDVEDFIRDGNKIIEFTRQRIAMSYVVLAPYKKKPAIVGYFTVANKNILIAQSALSNTLRKRIAKFATFDQMARSFRLACPLIAQMGKNYDSGYNTLITGAELLALACRKVKQAQTIIGGKTVYLECEDAPKLKSFYRDNGFFEIGMRRLDGDEEPYHKEKHLVQMLRYLG
jgi:hypothetical protein